MGAKGKGVNMSELARTEIGVIVVDLQGDFTVWKEGTLAVWETDAAFVKKVLEATVLLQKEGLSVYATQDWHPTDHVSFTVNHPGKENFDSVEVEGRIQVLWPCHCVQGTEGAEVLLDNNIFQAIVKKGQNPTFDSYSGFQDEGGTKTELDSILRAARIQKLVIYGLATDYCVRATAIDAVANGYKVVVIESLSKGVAPDSTAKAVEEMKAKGIVVLKEIDLEAIIAA